MAIPLRGDDPSGSLPASHLDLLESAREMQMAARAADLNAVHTALCQLQTALVAHVRAERDHLERLAPPARELVVASQGHLVRRVGQLLFTTTDAADDCACLAGAIELAQLLARQAKLELGLGLVPASVDRP